MCIYIILKNVCYKNKRPPNISRIFEEENNMHIPFLILKIDSKTFCTVHHFQSKHTF